MKRLLICLFLIICFIFPACAEEAPEDAVLALVHAQYPGCTIAQADQCGHTAAAALEHEGKKILCIWEKQGGQWVMTVNSSTILQPDAEMPSSLYLDDDQTLFWTYIGLNDHSFHFHASRAQDGHWYFNDEIMIEVIENSETNNGLYETMMVWSEEMDGCLVVTERLSDENENLIYQKDPLYFPAAWLKDKMDLRYFDISKLPYLMELEYPGQWPDHNYRRAAAAQLMPEYTYQGGSMSGKSLQFLMDKPEDVLLMILPVGARLPLGDLRQLKMQTVICGYIVFLFQHGGDSGFVALIDLPQEGIDGCAPGAGIRNIEHIAQGKLTGIVVQQGDALGAAPYIPVHGVVPQIVFGTGGGVRALGVNEQLVAVLVFVQPGGGGQIGSPASVVAGDLPRGVLRQLYVG